MLWILLSQSSRKTSRGRVCIRVGVGVGLSQSVTRDLELKQPSAGRACHGSMGSAFAINLALARCRSGSRDGCLYSCTVVWEEEEVL